MRILLISLILCFSIFLQAQPVKVMTNNIRYANKNDGENSWDKRKEKVVELINYYEPEILGVQEGLSEQVKYIDSLLSDYSFIGVGRDDGIEKGEYCAIFFDTTKFRLQYHATFWLSETPGKPSIGWDAAMERICTYAILKSKTNRDNYFVFNTHFDHIGAESQMKSAELILKKIKNLTGNLTQKTILIGDLNVTPDSEALRILVAELDDSKNISIKKPYGPIGTFNGFKTDHPLADRIDYILTKNLSVKSYRTVDDRLINLNYPSDHLPVIIEVE